MAETPEPSSFRYRIRREAGGLFSRLRDAAAPLLARAARNRAGQWVSARFGQARVAAAPLGEWSRVKWGESRGFRLLGYAAGAMLGLYLLVWVTIGRTLPSADSLLSYQPPLPTMVRGNDGEIVYSFARDRRVQLRYVDFPKQLVDAYLSAEDKTFWSHGGVDFTGLAGAVLDYVTKFGSGKRAKGGSTITQQVAKNILIGNEYSVTRKLKEMIVARRIESVLTKQQILELYLNEIPLGRRSFGVQAASRAYFGKDVGELKLHEAAFLAILPKAPETYSRARFADLALARRNYVLDQMVRNGWTSASEAAEAKAQPLGLIPIQPERYDPSSAYFVEEVRRRLIDRFGENAEAGPNSVYAGGLWVRTSLDTALQKAAQDSLRAGLMRYQGGRGWSGPVARIKLDPEQWARQLAGVNLSVHYSDWRIGVVVQRSGSQARVGFTDGKTYPLTGVPDGLRAGDVIAVAPASGGAYALRSVPGVSGGMLAEDPHTGRVLAVQGGFDAGLGAFNRATQAKRQPGSTIKPFVYATALDYGMSPATQVVDGTFCVFQTAELGEKCFKNFDMRGAGGTHTMRWGLEQSRNLMTVRIANDTGMDRVVKTIDQVGIGRYQPYLSYALGAGDTTVLQMVNAYAALANGGVQYAPTLIDFVQDRNGKVIWRADNRRCGNCSMAQWDGKPMPRLAPRGKQVLDPRTAYQVVHMLEGVVQRGTAVVLRDLGLPLFGKTGTTSGPTNVWFVGGSPDIVGGVYIGYDQPKNLGGWIQGGTFAAPIFKQFVQQSRSRWTHQPFVAPADIRMIKIDRVTGKRVFGADPTDDPLSSVIWEAFKSDSDPGRITRQDELTKQRDAILSAVRRAAGPGAADSEADGAEAETPVTTVTPDR